MDLRALNSTRRKDGTPIPHFQDTPNQLGKAKWFNKMDVSSAIWKILIAEGEQWKTAFCTSWSLFKWPDMPFGLTSPPSTFQQFMKETLRDLLDKYVAAYIEDVLIYSSGSKENYRAKVCKVLRRLKKVA